MVRFGTYLEHHAVPEWASQYLDYAALARTLGPVYFSWKGRKQRSDTQPAAPRAIVVETSQVDDESARLLSSAPPLLSPSMRRRSSMPTPTQGDSALNSLLKGTMQTVDNMFQQAADRDTSVLLPLADFLNLIPHKYAEDIAFFELLYAELDKVNRFFDKQMVFFREQFDSLLQQIRALKAARDSSAKLDFVRIDVELKAATKQLHHGLSLLLNYRVLNHSAIVKLCARYDKCVDTKIATEQIVPLSTALQFYSSDQLPELVASLEKLYADHFSHDNDDNDSLDLRPPSISRSTVFHLGFSVGLVITMIALVVVYLTLDPDTTVLPQFLASFPIFRGVALLSFQIWLWAAVLFVCQVHHINVVFILDADPRTALSHQHVWYMAANVTLLIFSALIVYLALLAYTKVVAGWVHLAAFAVLLIMAVWPFNSFFRPTRMFLWETLRDIVIAPFSAVLFHHFFIADILTSLIRALQDTAYTFCFYVTGEFLSKDPNQCQNSYTLLIISYVLALLPFYWRFMQCLRRYRDDPQKQQPQLWNALKYFTSMLATLFNLIAHNEFGYTRSVMITIWIVIAIISSLYSFCWDVYKDWGLFHYESPEFPLREHRLFPKFAYYLAIVTDFLLRLSWILTISPHTFGFDFPPHFFLFAVALLEIFRRNLWALLRLEYEHLDNSEHYRVVSLVPLFFASKSASSLRTFGIGPLSSIDASIIQSNNSNGETGQNDLHSSRTLIQPLTAQERKKVLAKIQHQLARAEGRHSIESASESDFE